MSDIAQETDTADRKLIELILYIVTRCLDASLGGTKLNKVLFYSDFAAFLKLGKSISGQGYFALKAGPAPKRLVPVREQMLKTKALEIYEVSIGEKYTQHRFIPKRPYNLAAFSAEEISIVDQMIERFVPKTATEVSGESHNFVGWLNAALEEDIPYSTAFTEAGHILGTDPAQISKPAIEYGRALEHRAGELRKQYA